jgi:hypothetical protein
MRPLATVAGSVLAVSIISAAHAAEPPKTYAFEVRPYGGAALGDSNDQAQPGAKIEFGPAAETTKGERAAARLKAMGIRDGADFDGKGRWYLFVGGSGTALGFNMKRDPDGLLRSYGWSVDPGASVGDIQAGVGWREGPLESSFGYVHRKFRPAYAMENIDFDNKDDMVGVTLSLKPRVAKPERR